MRGADKDSEPRRLRIDRRRAGTECVDTAAAYSQRTNVKLTAKPAAGKAFDHWTGDSTGTNPTISVPMTAAKSVTAVFRNGPSTAEVALTPEP